MALRIEDGDWIPVWRKIRRSWLWRDPEALRAWLDIIMLANHHPGHFDFRGNLLTVERGQVPTTYKSLAERNGWSRDRVRRFLTKLELSGSVRVSHRTYDGRAATWTDTKSDSGLILLTLVNYPLTESMSANPTGKSTGKPTPKSTGDRQEIGRRLAGDRHIQEGEEGTKKGEGEGDAPAPDGYAGDDPGGAAPPAPPAGAPEGLVTPTPNGEETEIPPDMGETLFAFREFQRPGTDWKIKAFMDLVRRGVSHEKLRRAAVDWRAWDFYDIVRALEAGRPLPSDPRPTNGVHAPEAAKAAGPSSTEARARQDEAIHRIDLAFAGLPEETRQRWIVEANEEADRLKVIEVGRKVFRQHWLRRRTAKEFGIEGF